MAKNNKTILILLIITFFAIIIRGYLSTLINTGDVLVQLEWAKTIYKQKLSNSYFYPIWTYSPPTQPPLMMLSFWFSQHIYENRYLLSEIHNIIRIPPAAFILWFDKFGEFFLIRLWEILSDLVASLIIFKLVSNHFKKKWLAILAFTVVIFNPITLFETGIWGQNDLFSAVFIYLSFYIINTSSSSFIISPLFFILAILSKPVGLILFPFYIFYYLFRLIKNKSNYITKIINPIISIVICCLLTYLIFLPFVGNKKSFISETTKIVFNRISPQSKGVSRGSISAFNFYSLFYKIDYTLGSENILGLSLDNWGYFLFILINIISISIFIQRWSTSKKDQLCILSFILFFISQGTFLFMTGMLERYFFPGFIAAILLTFLSFSKVGWNMIIQQILWFINLFYAFFLRELDGIRPFFWNNNYLMIRIISLFTLINFFVIYYRYIIRDKRPDFN